MNNSEYLKKLYFDNCIDFTDNETCAKLKQDFDNMALSEKPLISYMMCTYNDLSLLSAAVSSLINQEFKDWELIVLDNSDSNDDVWHLLEIMSEADGRIKIFRSEKNLGWAKGASVCMTHIYGTYTTFLAADDCINKGVLNEIAEILKKKTPDILWVGNAYVEVDIASKEANLITMCNKKYTEYNDKNKLANVYDIMDNLYYNSFFHYMRVDFLNEHNIDFYEQYYGDCAGMTKALSVASNMVVYGKVVYMLTMNTSQTFGKYTQKSYDIIYGNQWRSIKSIADFNCIGQDIIREEIAYRILKNALGNIGIIAKGAFRNTLMKPIEVSKEDAVKEIENMIAHEDIQEMLYMAGHRGFLLLLDNINLAFSEEGYVSISDFDKSYLAGIIKIACYENLLEDELLLIIDWLKEEKNNKMIGYEYMIELLKEGGRDLIGKYKNEYVEVRNKFNLLKA